MCRGVSESKGGVGMYFYILCIIYTHIFICTLHIHIYLQRKHIKTAICEKCDDLFAQSDVKCPTCDAVRSAKNQKLFRPLGFGNITDD